MTERSIFLTALDIADPAKRTAYLDQACGDDSDLRTQVESLLSSHQQSSQFLETPATAGDSAVEMTIVSQSSGDDDDDEQNAADVLGEAELKRYLQPSTRTGWLGRLAHYEIEHILGRGAFGIVAKAFDEKLHRVVAIKFMNPDLAATSPPRKRFLREARTAAAVRHENIVGIFAVEEEPLPYLVMEYVPGITLQQRLVQNGPMEQPEILRIGQQVAAGLAAAHAANLIHRDIKPSNILLEEGIEERAKISDFGLARAVDDASLTSSGLIAGTPMYMAPEQARGEVLDHRADLFSLGSVLYQMSSGRPPFRAANTIAVLKRVCEDRPRPIQDVISGIPDWLCTIIFRLLEKDPVNRYQTAKEVAALFARCQTELQFNGKVTCVQSRHLAPRDEPSTASTSSSNRPSPNQYSSQPAPALPSATLEGSSRRSETATLKRPLLLIGSILAIAAIIAVFINNRTPDPANGGGQPSEPIAAISNSKSQISNPVGWHGWPADAPPPAIAPFNAEQAKQHQEAWAKYLKIDVEYTNSIGMKFRLIPPGEFTMGSTAAEIEKALKFVGQDKHWQDGIKSEAPQHKVILTQPIYLGVNEVSQAEYEKVMGMNPSHFTPMGAGKDAVAGMETTSHPVEMVSWNDAAEFCAKLSKQEGLKPFYFGGGETITSLDGTGYRLPTEAEWENACRAGTTTKYWIGQKDVDLVGAGWFGTNSGSRTHAAGELKANPYGLRDIHGNVWEWVEDCWSPTYYGESQEQPAVDPIAPFHARSRRVVRGGNWYCNASGCRAADRIAGDPPDCYLNLGFRAVLVVGASRVGQASKVTEPAMPKSVATTPSAPDTTNPGWHGWPADAPPPAIAPFNAEQAKLHQEAWAKYLNVPVEYTNSIGMKFKLIPPGEFMMGNTAEEIETQLKDIDPKDMNWLESIMKSEGPQHKVILTQPIYLGVNEVTQAEYEKVTGVNPSYFAPMGAYKDAVPGLETAEHPVEGVSWNDAAEFCAKISKQEKLKPFYFRAGETITPLDGTGYRLPSEAEWEYACRAGTTTKYWIGDKEEELVRAAWFGTNSGRRTHAAGELKANPYGLFDVHGNVWELVQDGWDATWYGQFMEKPAVNPNSPFSSESQRVIRGCDWGNAATPCRSSYRTPHGPATRWGNIGFRVSLPVNAVKAAIPEGIPALTNSDTNKKGWHDWPANAPKPAVAPFDAAQAERRQEEWAAYLKVPVEYSNTIGMKFRLIPPGEFMMGSTAAEIEEALTFVGEDKHWQNCVKSEAPQHKVILTQPFYMGVTEVTQAEYEKVMGVNPSHFATTGTGKDAVTGMDTTSHPVEKMSWYDAADFCAKLSNQEKLKPFYFRNGETVTPLNGTGYRLPSEAEWEYACRAGTTTKYWVGDKDEDLVRAGWFWTNSGSRTHAAGELKANPYGLFDMHGNVWEFVEDWHSPTYYREFHEKPAIDPAGPFAAGSQHVVRGGHWSNNASMCRSAIRPANEPVNAGLDIGFRASLPVDAVRQALKVLGLAMPKSVATTPPAPDLAPIDFAAERQAAE